MKTAQTYTFDIWDDKTKEFLGVCHSNDMMNAIRYARKRYPNRQVFVCRKPKE